MKFIGKLISTVKARPRRRSRWLACESGATAVEFSFVALPMLALLIAILQIGVIFLAQNELETAVEKSSRLLFTGQAQTSNLSQSQFHADVCGYLSALFNCSGVMVDLQSVAAFANANTSAPTLNADGTLSNVWAYVPGTQNSTLVLRIFYQFPIVSGPLGFILANPQTPGKRLLISTAVFQVQNY